MGTLGLRKQVAQNQSVEGSYFQQRSGRFLTQRSKDDFVSSFGENSWESNQQYSTDLVSLNYQCFEVTCEGRAVGGRRRGREGWVWVVCGLRSGRRDQIGGLPRRCGRSLRCGEYRPCGRGLFSYLTNSLIIRYTQNHIKGCSETMERRLSLRGDCYKLRERVRIMLRGVFSALSGSESRDRREKMADLLDCSQRDCFLEGSVSCSNFRSLLRQWRMCFSLSLISLQFSSISRVQSVSFIIQYIFIINFSPDYLNLKTHPMQQQEILHSVKSVVKSHIRLLEEALSSNEQNYLNSKMWVKQAFNNLFNLLPSEVLDSQADFFLTHQEQEALLNNPLSSIEFFKEKFKREINEQDWEDEVEPHNTPPKKQFQQVRSHQTSNMGFRKNPASKLQSSHKKVFSARLHKYPKRN